MGGGAHNTGYLTLEVRRGPKQGCRARLTGMASLLDSASQQVRAGAGHRSAQVVWDMEKRAPRPGQSVRLKPSAHPCWLC